MERRNFLKGAAVAAVAATVPFTIGKNPNDRIVEIDTEEGWVRAKMQDLKPGDVFRMKEPDGSTVLEKGVADSIPFYIDNVWGIRIAKPEWGAAAGYVPRKT